MKKTICLLLILVMLFALIACGGSKTPEKPSGNKTDDTSDNTGKEPDVKTNPSIGDTPIETPIIDIPAGGNN